MNIWSEGYKDTEDGFCGFLFPEILKKEHEEREANIKAFVDELPYFENPANDNERLLNLQKEYITTGSRRAESQLWLECLEIAKKLVSKELKEKGVHLNSFDREDKALDAIEYMLRRYKKKYGHDKRKARYWAVRSSFFSALYQAVRHSLYYEGRKRDGVEKVTIEYVGDLFESVSYKEATENEEE